VKIRRSRRREGANAMSQVIKIDGAPLLLFALPDGLVVESYELARALGYTQHSSIRKQILTDWKEHLRPTTHWNMVNDHRWLEKYEALHIKEIGPIKPVTEQRGRLFLTPAGMAEVLSRTSKKNKVVLQGALEKEGFLDAAVRKSSPKNTAPAPEVTGSGIDTLVAIKEGLAEDRRFKYQVIQTLLTQLQDFDDPELCILAVEAAEIALGRKLTDLRNRYAFQAPSPRGPKPPTMSAPSSTAKPPSNLGVPDGPVFKETGFYGLKQIGEMAGGYAASVAGKAANVVAEEIGHTAEEIRTEQLDFNELPMLPDSSTGKPRKMYRFNLMFSNAVIRELRENADFRPRDRPMPLTSFSSGSHPKLSQGPFSEEDAAH
jgi:hypothetical protein